MTNQRIDRQAFQNLASGHELRTQAVALDPRLAGAGLERADSNGDGVIRGRQELDALFDLLSHSSPRRSRMRAGVSRTLLQGVAEQMNAPRMRAMIERPGAAVHEAVLALGMNDSSEAEVGALRRQADVLYVGDLPSRRDQVETRSGLLDLAQPADVGRFVEALPLIPAQRQQLRALLLHVRSGARRELGELARIWSQAEAGGTVPARLMLSGHGDHRSVFGEHGEQIDDADVVRLARIMPMAAGQIRSLHLAACQHGYEPRMAPFLAAFPNLDSAWGYAGFSPAGQPAQRHQAIWERATRSLPEGGGRLRRSMARGTRRGEAVRVWTRARGFDGPPLRELALVHREIEARRPLYDDLLAGRVEMNAVRHRELTELYQALQEITAHGDFREQTDAFQTDHTRMRGAALRLRFYPNVASHFTRAHAEAIRRGYADLGSAPPDFARLSRPEAMHAIEELSARVDQASPVASRLLQLLRRGLGELRESELPAHWIEGRASGVRQALG